MSVKSVSPFNLFQKTLSTSVSCDGTGVHSGLPIHLTLKPACANSGIVFKRVDIKDNAINTIPARLQSVVDTQMCTTIGNEHNITVSTIEHLMAALYACEIDNVIVEINGTELPIMDGSSHPFIEMIEEVGTVELNTSRSFIRVLETVEIKNEFGTAKLRPSNYPLYKAVYDFKGRANFGNQTFVYDGIPENFKKDIAEARTFGFLEDAEKVWSMGLAKGTSLENTVVIKDNSIINEDGLRFKNEFVRHKILDTVGDFYIAGFPLLAEFEGFNCGHTLNNLILKKLFSDCSNWELITPLYQPSMLPHQFNSLEVRANQYPSLL